MKRKKINILLVLQLLLLVIIAAACEGIAVDQPGVSPTTSLIRTIHPATLTAISASADPSATPVPDPMGIPWSSLRGIELEFWYIWDLDKPGEGINAIVDKFNLENDWGVKVNAVDQGLTLDPMDTIEIALQEGVVPALMISDTVHLGRWYRAGLTADLSHFIDDPVVGLSSIIRNDFYSGIFESFTLDGDIRPGIPFTQTIQVLYYNQTWAGELGFSSPPGTFEELKDQVCAASAAIQERTESSQELAGGLLMYPDADNITSWIYAYNGVILDPTKGDYEFSSQEVYDVARDWIKLGQDGCGYMISGYPNPIAREIEFEKFNQRDALVMMNSSQNMNQISMHANQTGRPDDWIMLPFLGSLRSKAVSANIQSGVIFNTSPEEELAAWLFLKYLTSPEVQAEWIQYSDYYPTRKDALDYLEDYRTDNPHWSRGLNLLKYGQADPLDPSWEIVRQAVGDAFEDLFGKNLGEISKLLEMLDQTAAELVEYSQE